MSKAIRIILPIILVLAILFCLGWYLFIYDREFTRDSLLFGARHFEEKGKHEVASWFYDLAYRQAGNNDAVAIELAMQHKASGNYTKAEYTLSNAIKDGGSAQLYIAMSQLFIEQDKLMDAVKLMDALTAENSTVDIAVRQELEALRPLAPTISHEPGFYSQYISVSLEAATGTLYVNPNGEYPSINDDPYTEPITLHDGENSIYAVAISDEGLVSPLSIFGFTVGGVTEEVNFADEIVEAEIRAALGANDNEVVMSNELRTITSFSVPANATDLSDLKYMTFLSELTITDCSSGQLSNLSPLANLVTLTVEDTSVLAEELSVIGKLPKLENLTLRNCSLSTTAGLEYAENLITLDLSDNTIRNISALSSMKSLQQANLQHNVITDLCALSASSSLSKLDVSYNTLTDISAISTLVGLNWLDVSNNTLTAVTGIEKLTALTYLNASNNTLTDVAALAACKQLNELNISNNTLTSLSGLNELTKLTKLDFSYNQVVELPEWSTDCDLVVIDGSYNQIESLKPLAGLSALNNVYMDYNAEIASVDSLSTCPRLIQVNVYGTKVTKAASLIEQSIIVNFDPTN